MARRPASVMRTATRAPLLSWRQAMAERSRGAGTCARRPCLSKSADHGVPCGGRELRRHAGQPVVALGGLAEHGQGGVGKLDRLISHDVVSLAGAPNDRVPATTPSPAGRTRSGRREPGPSFGEFAAAEVAVADLAKLAVPIRQRADLIPQSAGSGPAPKRFALVCWSSASSASNSACFASKAVIFSPWLQVWRASRSVISTSVRRVLNQCVGPHSLCVATQPSRKAAPFLAGFKRFRS